MILLTQTQTQTHHHTHSLLCFSVFGACADAPIYFDFTAHGSVDGNDHSIRNTAATRKGTGQGQAQAHGYPGFEVFAHELRVVDVAFIEGTSVLERPIVISCLRSAGVGDVTPDAIVFEYIIPSLVSASAKANIPTSGSTTSTAGESEPSRSMVIAWWKYLHAFWASLPTNHRRRVELITKLKQHSTILPVSTRPSNAPKSNTKQCRLQPAGYARIGVSPTSLIHFAFEHGNEYDLLRDLWTIARRLDWRCAALDELISNSSGGGMSSMSTNNSNDQTAYHTLKSWREFLLQLGVVDIAVLQKRVVVRKQSCDEIQWHPEWDAKASELLASLKQDSDDLEVQHVFNSITPNAFFTLWH